MTENTVELPDYVAVLRRRKATIAIVMLLGIVLGAAYVLTVDKTYSSTAKILVNPAALGPALAGNTATSMDTEREVAASPSVARLARDELGPADVQDLLAHLTTDSPTDTLILELSYSDATASGAQAGARAFGDAYLKFKSRQLTQAGHANIAQDPGQIISPAPLPGSPSSPRPILDVGLAAFVGLFLGIVLAFVLERTDQRIRGRVDVEDVTDVPVLAVIPPRQAPRIARRWLAARKPAFPAPASYIALSAWLLRRMEQSGMRTFLVSGATQSRTASGVTANLGVVLAQAGKRVLLVSGNLRDPHIHGFFGIQNDGGLVHVLEGRAFLTDVIAPSRLQDLAVVPAGTSGQGIELGHAERLQKVLADLQDLADVVLIEAPALLGSPDGILLAPLVDGVILVADSAGEKRPALLRARREVQTVGARVLGIVVANLEPEKADAYDAARGRRAGLTPADPGVTAF